jgi:lipoyl(octanoyl) transferase
MRVTLLGRRDYVATLEAMRSFTQARTPGTEDELWLVEHDPVYTQGVAGRAEHVRDARGIPLVRSDRGGQVTYHGPGQVVAYPLLDLRRLRIFVKEYVYRIEHSVLKTLEGLGVTGHRVSGAPGIYVRLDDPFGHAMQTGPVAQGARFAGLGKVAALGIKVSRHFSYHGVALNVGMDLSPFDAIDPCGYPGLRAIDLATLGVHTDWATVAQQLGQKLQAQLSV